MKFDNTMVVLVFAALALSLSTYAQLSEDNSKMNKNTTAMSQVSADQQNSSEADLKITSRIRQDVMKEKNFSTYAQNIKIITINGKVTLKGPVRASNEKESILKYAQAAAGATNVINEITIAPK